MNQFQQPQQQPVAVPYSGILTVSDQGVVPDGQYPVQLTRVETYQGTKYQSNEPQNKLRFILTVSSGPQQGQEIWAIENLPDSGKPLGPKSGLRKFLGLLRGKALVDGESVDPAAFVGTLAQVLIGEGKIVTVLPQQAVAQQTMQTPRPAAQSMPQQQPAVQPQQSAQQPPVTTERF